MEQDVAVTQPTSEAVPADGAHGLSGAADGADRLAEPGDLEQPPRLAFPVVGIGCAAGGLEAFTTLFSVMPADSGMAFVLILHPSQDGESMIAESLQCHTAMVVMQVEDGLEVQPDHVYVTRPGDALSIKDGRLQLGFRLERPRHSRPVDDFFRSLAEEQRERAICVVMSGAGSNGAAGAQAIKAAGGLCIAQEPESAQVPSMPCHLIDAGYADLILAPEEMPEALVGYSHHPYAARRKAGAVRNHAASNAAELQREQHQVREILAIVRARTRLDFTGYKKPTVLRRIQRRMGLNRVTDLGRYAKMLRRSSLEATGLANDLLIHVTGFFRDPEAWETLRQRVIIPLVRSRETEGAIRCWVAACSSGEEAYSLAMLLVEESERAGKRLNIKVFATDTAERTLSNARNGVYPGGIESQLPPERLQRFFDREDTVYRVRQDLRERVVFASQNVLSDPPFSGLDIVTCRNLLIYLEPEIQQRVLSLIHFGLRNRGVLFLGNRETVPVGMGTFEPIDKKARIYKRVGPTRYGAIDFSQRRAVARDAGDPTRPVPSLAGAAPPLAQLTARALLALHVPAAVVVDRSYRVVYYQGETQSYLGQRSGEPTQDLLVLANDPVRGAVRMALQRSMATQSVERGQGGLITNAEGQRSRVVVTASPLVSGETSDLFVVSFQQREEPESLLLPQSPPPDPMGAAPSSAEVQRLRDELQSAIAQLQASNEEHRAAAEEAMSLNEELQSSNRELQTSREEMQSLNEEFSAVNSQLHAKVEELQRTTGDLRSLLASTDIAVIFVDSQFRIRRYTPAARKLLELIGSDIGRPLNDLHEKFVDPDLFDDSQAVLDRLVPAEREVRSNDGRWYARRVLPYRTAEDGVEGVVITFVDITDRKRAHDLAMAGDAARGDLQVPANPHATANLPFGAADTHTVLEEILLAALELHASNQGDLHLYDPVSQKLRLTAQRGLSSELVSAWGSVNLSESTWPLARALREQAPVLIEDVERQLPETPFREQWLAAGIRAAQCVPLITRDGEQLGVLTVHFRQPHRPDSRSVRISALLARLGADTVERMRIVEERARLLRSEQLARRALDEAVQMKDDFLATLSHELRTPLAAIMLWGKVLRRGAANPEELERGLDAIISSADAQSCLIEDLLDTSRAAAGKLQLELGETDLVGTLRSVVELTDPAASAKNLHIESDLSPAVGTVIADAMRIRQVVWNLLTNAVKFTPDGGQIRVALTRADEEVRITVTDNGVGIAPEFLPHIFDRFRQYDASITRNHGGLGLGLAISKQLVEMHGGTIRAESAGRGQGATFTVSLPMPAARRSSQYALGVVNAAPARGTLLNGIAVLVVEDDPQTQGALAVILRQSGANVTIAASAAEAIQAYGAARPDIVLSDVGLPDLDGYALLERIRAFDAERQLPEVPAVALTAYTREEDRSKAAAAGFVSHVGKPVDADELLAVLLEALPER